jgi:hypothetical protein
LLPTSCPSYVPTKIPSSIPTNTPTQSPVFSVPIWVSVGGLGDEGYTDNPSLTIVNGDDNITVFSDGLYNLPSIGEGTR